MLVGFTNGCFDCFHEGHLHFIDKCLQMAEYLIVAVNTDESVSMLKGNDRPKFRVFQRLNSVLMWRDFGRRKSIGIPFDGDPKPLLQAIKPDILFRGEDQTITDFERAMFCDRIVVIPRLPGFSTTEELAKLDVDGLRFRKLPTEMSE